MVTATQYVVLITMVTMSQVADVGAFSAWANVSNTWVCGCLNETVRLTVFFEPSNEPLTVIRWFKDPGPGEERVYSYIPSMDKHNTVGPMDGRVTLDYIKKSDTSPHGSVTLVINPLEPFDTRKTGSTYIQYRCEIQDASTNPYTVFFNLTLQHEPKCAVLTWINQTSAVTESEPTLEVSQVEGYFGNVTSTLDCTDVPSGLTFRDDTSVTSSWKGSCMNDAIVQYTTTYTGNVALSVCLSCTVTVTQGGLSTTETGFTPCFQFPTDPSCPCKYSEDGVLANIILLVIAVVFGGGIIVCLVCWVYRRRKKEDMAKQHMPLLAGSVAIAVVCFLFALADIIVIVIMTRTTCAACDSMVLWEIVMLVIGCLLCVLSGIFLLVKLLRHEKSKK